MGRTPGDLDDIFAAADANDGKLTKEIFDEHDGSELMTYGNAQRRYKQHRAAGSTHAAGGAGAGAAGAEQATTAAAGVPLNADREGATTQVQTIATPHQAAVARANVDRRREAYEEAHKEATAEAAALRPAPNPKPTRNRPETAKNVLKPQDMRFRFWSSNRI